MKITFKILVTIPLLFIVFMVLAQGGKENSIVIKNQDKEPFIFYKADMVNFRRITAQLKEKDGKEHTYSGIAISDILQKAGVAMGKQLHGENMSQYMLAKAGDGYKVSYSLAELDSSFTNRTIILADQLDGGALPAGKGPFRIIVPGEKKPARSMYEVLELIIRSGKEE